MNIGYHIIVEGKVQGVGFRYFTKQRADRLKILGKVQNKYDGSVEIFAFGEKEKIAIFLQSIARGPSYSFVRRTIKKKFLFKKLIAF